MKHETSTTAHLSRPESTVNTLVKMSSFLRMHSLAAVANIVCAVLSLSSALAFPQLTQMIVDGIVSHRDISYLLTAIGSLFAVFLLRDVFSALHTLVSNSLEQRLIYEMRERLYRHLQRLPVPYFDRMSSGDLMTRVIDDVTDVARLLVEGLEQSVLSSATILFVMAILFVKNAYLAMAAFVPLPFVILGSAWFTVTAHGRLRAKRRSLSALTAMLLENLQGIRQIKVSGHSEYNEGRFNNSAKELHHRTMRVLSLWAMYVPAMTFFTSLGTVLVWGIGVSSVLGHKLSLGELIGFVFYLSMLYTPVINIHGLNSLVQAARTASERLFEILEQSDEEASWPVIRKIEPAVLGEVRYEAVTFGYEPNRIVLDNITLHVKPRQTIAVVGRTGAGKSTLVSFLLGFYMPNSGRVLIDGHDIMSFSLEFLRNQVSVVFQEPFLFNGTIRENLLHGRLDASEAEMIAVAQATACHDFIIAFPEGYDTVIGERGRRLSSGEKQRISTARAILKKSPILVLDEAMANVDTLTERQIREGLQRIGAERTIFVVTHHLRTIVHADQILVLQDGAIVERGTHASLLSLNGIYAKMFLEQKLLTDYRDGSQGADSEFFDYTSG